MLKQICSLCTQGLCTTGLLSCGLYSCLLKSHCHVHGLQTVKFNGMEWSLWDRWILEGDLTVQQVLNWFKVGLARPLRPQSSHTITQHSWACSTSAVCALLIKPLIPVTLENACHTIIVNPWSRLFPWTLNQRVLRVGAWAGARPRGV